MESAIFINVFEISIVTFSGGGLSFIVLNFISYLIFELYQQTFRKSLNSSEAWTLVKDM